MGCTRAPRALHAVPICLGKVDPCTAPRVANTCLCLSALDDFIWVSPVP